MITQIKNAAKRLLGLPTGNDLFSKITSDDMFLVSFPRSGNTWTRNLVAHILYPDEHIESFNQLQRFVPDIYGRLPPRKPDQRLVIKTHESYITRHGAN